MLATEHRVVLRPSQCSLGQRNALHTSSCIHFGSIVRSHAVSATSCVYGNGCTSAPLPNGMHHEGGTHLCVAGGPNLLDRLKVLLLPVSTAVVRCRPAVPHASLRTLLVVLVEPKRGRRSMANCSLAAPASLDFRFQGGAMAVDDRITECHCSNPSNLPVRSPPASGL
jgi:hypothetical protein